MRKIIIALNIVLFLSIGIFGAYRCGSKPNTMEIVQLVLALCWPIPEEDRPQICFDAANLYLALTGGCTSCPVNYSIGYCRRLDYNPDAVEIGNVWVTQNGTGKCGRTTIVSTGVVTSYDCVYSACNSMGATQSSAMLDSAGAFATGAGACLPAGVSSLNPANGSVISTNTGISVTLDKSVDITSLNIGGTLGNIDPNSVQISQKNQFRDTITIPPQPEWLTGANKNITINGTDLDGLPIALDLKFSVYANNANPSPNFSNCVPSCKFGWSSPYSVQFQASGGFAPYTWTKGSGAPPGATITSNGLLSGPATNNVLGQYSFPVTVMDAAGTTVTKTVMIDTVDLVTACFLLGVCSL